MPLVEVDVRVMVYGDGSQSRDFTNVHVVVAPTPAGGGDSTSGASWGLQKRCEALQDAPVTLERDRTDHPQQSL